jgi:uncharacterized membrane protein YgcG
MYKALRTLFLVLAIIGVSVGLHSIPATAINVNNFEIADYQIDYYLSKDKDGRSSLKTEETIRAVFPAFDQNHGIERAIPGTYDGHKTSLKLTAVTNEAGQAWNYSTREENGNTILRIGDADRYVHGVQTYKLSYMQRDVTKYFADTNDDEFYWDTNGTQWAVPVVSITARLHIDQTLAAAKTEQVRCYAGAAGSSSPCEITPTADGYTASTGPLQPYENMTLAVGFQPHTFAAYQKTTGEILLLIWIFLFLATVPLAFMLTTWFIVRWIRRSNRTRELGAIVPEYLPPKEVSVSTAAVISAQTTRTFSAQLLDLAVRHYLKVYQTREKSLFRSAEYELEIVKDISDLRPEEQEMLHAIFSDPRVGARLAMKELKRNSAVASKMLTNRKKLIERINDSYKLREHDERQTAWFKRAAGFTLVAGLLTLSPWLVIAAIVAFICGWTLKPLTDTGLALVRYLKGLELYIKIAETERLRLLQSPEGAAKVGAPVNTNDKRQLIKLYERVLPYAVLFGQEKEWNKRLGEYYQAAGEQPEWFSGRNGVFNAAAFGAAVSSFNSVASYSSASSASAGGSSGGGSSGGGGGGGGGGGW